MGGGGGSVGGAVGTVVGSVGSVAGTVGTVGTVGGSVTTKLLGTVGTVGVSVGRPMVVWVPVVWDGCDDADGRLEEASGSMAQPLTSSSTSSMESNFFIKSILFRVLYSNSIS